MSLRFPESEAIHCLCVNPTVPETYGYSTPVLDWGLMIVLYSEVLEICIIEEKLDRHQDSHMYQKRCSNGATSGEKFDIVMACELSSPLREGEGDTMRTGMIHHIPGPFRTSGSARLLGYFKNPRFESRLLSGPDSTCRMETIVHSRSIHMLISRRLCVSFGARRVPNSIEMCE